MGRQAKKRPAEKINGPVRELRRNVSFPGRQNRFLLGPRRSGSKPSVNSAGNSQVYDVKALKQVKFREIISLYDNKSAKSSSFKWTKNILKKADASAQGRWQLVELTPEEVCSKITLPWHHHGDEGDGKGMELIPKSGMTVRHVTENIMQLMPEYKKQNSRCLRNIDYLRKQDPNPIILSTKALKGYGLFPYDQMEVESGNLIHLDGLHRLIAWSIDGRFKHPKSLFYGQISAYLAEIG